MHKTLEPMFVTIPEAGRVLGVSRNHAYRMAAEGLLPTVPISENRRRVPLAALARLCDQAEREARERREAG